jgi:hypothetical protein
MPDRRRVVDRGSSARDGVVKLRDRKLTAAILADDCRGDALADLCRGAGVLGKSSVGVAVRIDETGRNDIAGRVDDPFPGTGVERLRDCGDRVGLYAQVSAARGAAGAVDDLTATN